ncbi:MAG TPA: hypothetical protein VF198_05905 [Vicinamibacterales bacterium]
MVVPFALILFVLAPDPAAAPGTHRVDCRGTGEGAAREFVLTRPAADAPWQLSYRDAGRREWIHLPLPGAEPSFEGSGAQLRYRNANGGRQIELEVRAGAPARLDVYVDYGLDVNIDPDLDPEVDRLNTDGPLTVECTVSQP